MSVQRVLILLWKYLLVKEEELFCWWKVSKFLLAALFANAGRVDVSKFWVENTAILRLRPSRKLIFLLFSEIKGFLREQLTSDYIRLLIYLKAKNEVNRFFNSCYFLTVALKRLMKSLETIAANFPPRLMGHPFLVPSIALRHFQKVLAFELSAVFSRSEILPLK